MSILVNEETRLIVQGITGREGTFHTEQMLAYGTKVVAGVTPGKGGQSILGVPVYNTVKEAMEKHNANASVLFVPPKFMYPAAYEAILSGMPLVITIAEGVPVFDMLRLYHLARERGCRLIGPNSFGIISPGKSKAGFMDHRNYLPGNIGIMSRSATNCYESVFHMKKKNLGQSTCLGIGGDMVPGSPFVDILPLFEADPQTEIIVMIGEIGGSDEETAAEYIRASITKPVVALIAGKNAPKDTSMGHAGAIVSPNGEGSADNKEKALISAGVTIAESTEDLARILSAM